MKATIIIIFIILILIGAFVLIYFFYEKPVEKETQLTYYNAEIKILYNDTQIDTGFVITLDSSTEAYQFGNSTSQGYSLIKIPTNRTFKVYNINGVDDSYYTTVSQNDNLDLSDVRIDMSLIPYGHLDIKHYGLLDLNNPVFLNLNSTGTFKGLSLCFRWSPRIISVSLDNYTDILIPTRLENKVDKCYDTNITLTDSSLSIPINYKSFGALTTYDYIDIYILDRDLQYDKINQYSIESSNGSDIGISDIKYRINY